MPASILKPKMERSDLEGSFNLDGNQELMDKFYNNSR